MSCLIECSGGRVGLGPGDKACWTHGAGGEGSTHHQPPGSRGHLAGLALCLLCLKAQRTAVCVVWQAGSQGLPRLWAPHTGSHRGPAGWQLCVSPQVAPVLALGRSSLHRAPSRPQGVRLPWSPGGAGATRGWGVPILSGQPGLPTPTAPAPVTPGLVSSRKATGLQGRPVCEPERFTGLPRAQGSLLSGQSPAGPSCVASGSYLPAASPDPHRPVNSRLRLLAGEIQCFCKSQKFLDFPIPCLWL